MCDKLLVQLGAGVALTTCGVLTSSYIIYSRYCTPHPTCISTLLSETVATIAIGILHLYWYSSCITSTHNMTGERVTDTNQNMPCIGQDNILMHHAVMIAAAIHCFTSLASDCMACNKRMINMNKNEELEVKEGNSSRKNILLDTVRSSTCGTVIGHWLVPALGVILLYYIVYENKICVNTTTLTNIVEGFQSIVTKLLEQSANVSETSGHTEEIESIVGKVYTIVDSVTQNNSELSDAEENMEILNIIDKMNSLSARTPKHIESKILYSAGFKIYMLIFILFVYLIMAYSNVKYVKAKMLFGGINGKQINKNNLESNVKYLKMLIIAAVVLWTPSLMELIARTYITQNQPNIISQILLTTGNVYLLLRDGIHLKLLKANIKAKNCVQPSA